MLSAETINNGLDLNLLRVLAALDQTRHVSRAAELLGMSQSGFSTALWRLRQQFDDELFMRADGRMQPTARAQQLLPTARRILQEVHDQILGQPQFQPAGTDTCFRLALTDVAEVIYLPTLLQHLARSAPGASVHTQLLPGDQLREAMSSGSVDLAIGYFPDLGSQQFFKQRLYTHTFACIARSGHPLAGRLDIAAYQACGHAVAASPARSTGLLEEFLARRKITRRIVAHTPHHLVLPAIIAQTDLIATVPLVVAEHQAFTSGLEIHALPFRPPKFDIQQHWHRGVHKDPRNQWLRAQVHALFGASAQRWKALELSLYPVRDKATP